jgi:hypothetical protein
MMMVAVTLHCCMSVQEWDNSTGVIAQCTVYIQCLPSAIQAGIALITEMTQGKRGRG